MAYSNLPIFTTAVATANATLSAGTAWVYSSMTSANTATVLTAGVNGCRVTSLILSTNDTTANNVFVLNDHGGTGTGLAVIGQVNVPIDAGTTASTLSVDALNSAVTVGLPIDNNGKRFIHLGPNDILRIGVVTNMTVGKALTIFAVYENY